MESANSSISKVKTGIQEAACRATVFFLSPSSKAVKLVPFLDQSLNTENSNTAGP
jgi:hypothetical protein